MKTKRKGKDRRDRMLEEDTEREKVRDRQTDRERVIETKKETLNFKVFGQTSQITQ